ncbi:MAG: glycosyltransferase family 4 protein [Kofleriaceae bacterium]
MARVLIAGFCAVPGPRRAGVQLRHVIRALAPLHSVDLLVMREGEQAYVERQGPVRVLRVPMQEAGLGAQIQAFQRALKRQLDGADYEIVHCRDSWSAVPVLEARSRLDYAVVYDLTRSPLCEPTLDPNLDVQYARDEQACLAAADLVLAPTPATVLALRTRVSSDRILLSPPGVDVDRFDWEEPSNSGPPRILYAGTIDPGRGVRVLVRAMAAVVRELDARLVLAGPIVPAFEQPLRDTIRELGLEHKVEILAPVDHEQMPALVASATVCVVPAAADHSPTPMVVFPTKILEYMACQRAIVAPRRDTVTAIVDDNHQALLFAPGDAADLAEKLVQLLRDPGLRARLAASAYERVRRELTASATRRTLRRGYDMLLEQFGERFERPMATEEAPKSEILGDDDFEATVFEEAPIAPTVDTAVNKVHVLADSLVALGDDGTGSSGHVAAPPAPLEEETMDSVPAVSPDPRATWTVSALAAPPSPSSDDWAVTNVAALRRSPSFLEKADGIDPSTTDDGTPIEGVSPAAPSMPVSTNFVAGEIDVPTPAPERVERSRDPDTDSRTPPLARR